jgi:hypothetical protein
MAQATTPTARTSRVLLAAHEAAHAAVAYLLGRGIEVVSIRETDHSRGETILKRGVAEGPTFTEPFQTSCLATE